MVQKPGSTFFYPIFVGYGPAAAGRYTIFIVSCPIFVGHHPILMGRCPIFVVFCPMITVQYPI